MRSIDIDTDSLTRELKSKASLAEGIKYIKENIENKTCHDLSEYFDKYLFDHQEMTRAQVIKDSQLMRSYAHEILNGKKKGSRDRIIALCFAAKMSLDETNRALMFSENSQLYPKNCRDAYIMLAINCMKNGSKTVSNVIQLSTFLDENGYEPLKLVKDY